MSWVLACTINYCTHKPTNNRFRHLFWATRMSYTILVARQVEPCGAISPWASYQILKIAGCACVGNVFPQSTSKEIPSLRSRHASRHLRHAVAQKMFLVFPAHAQLAIFAYLVRGPCADYSSILSGYVPFVVTRVQGCCKKVTFNEVKSTSNIWPFTSIATSCIYV